jgi:exopolyphosphatase/guanosine-5'-triphosphate,3'-diphosphate pyrophosphatase
LERVNENYSGDGLRLFLSQLHVQQPLPTAFTMTRRAAVLDLGTNTFNLLIAERLGGKIHFLHRDERWVYLAEDGMERIGRNAFKRMEDVLTHYRSVIDRYKPDRVAATGTAMFRRASNSDEARNTVKRLTGVEPAVISGDEEAILIYEGVRLSLENVHETVLVMDIGGGSTEFIIGNGDDVLWKKSYPLGASLLRQMFHRTEPITAQEQHSIKQFVLQSTLALQDAVQQFQPTALIGASGSFDSFVSMLMHPNVPSDVLSTIDKNELNALVDRLCRMNETERESVKGLVHYRAGPIVTAGVLARTVVEMLNVETIFRSAYALNEGAMKRLL